MVSSTAAEVWIALLVSDGKDWWIIDPNTIVWRLQVLLEHWRANESYCGDVTDGLFSRIRKFV
jgi:hypothetical protein